jgi:hypothetical protein
MTTKKGANVIVEVENSVIQMRATRAKLNPVISM